MTPTLRRLTGADLPRLRRFWEEHWGGAVMVVHGEVVQPEQVQGFVADDWRSLVTYLIRGDACEIISLDSLRENEGAGSALLEAVQNEARRLACQRLYLSTTNDNLGALGFYQRRGFEVVSVRRGSIDAARRLKPGIPLIGENGIRLRDEIELEKSL